MKTIPLTQGKVAIVDNEDYAMLIKHKWKFRKRKDRENGYAKREYDRPMTSDIMGDPPKRFVWDHINSNTLDNRRNNLRLASSYENARNKTKRKAKCSSKYKGVAWSSHNKKWMAYIGYNWKQVHIGYFESEKEAAIAYNEKARELHGEFANINLM